MLASLLGVRFPLPSATWDRPIYLIRGPQFSDFDFHNNCTDHQIGCDKTVPAQLMGGISSGKPVLPLITGPMMPGSFRGQRIGACTDCRNNWAAYRGDEINVEEISELNEELAPTAGTCGVMGTASTMACITAALGLLDLRAGAYV